MHLWHASELGIFNASIDKALKAWESAWGRKISIAKDRHLKLE
jgi:hypothetical protein